MPQWPYRNGSHTWNTIPDKNGKFLDFLGAEYNPEYRSEPGTKKGKVYRRTYAINPASIAVTKDPDDIVPDFLKKSTLFYWQIVPDQKYELFYWDNNTWNSMGVQTANGLTVTFNTKISNALFKLQYVPANPYEQRVFTYENDHQIWW